MYNQRALRLKEKLKAGDAIIGTWMDIPSSVVAGIVAGAGFDWVLVDAEHAVFDRVVLHDIVCAFKGTETVPFARVPWNDHVMIKQMLDIGFEGIITPQTNTLEEARQAIAACRYPPDGIRGYGPNFASNFARDEKEYVELANKLIFCVVQIESIHAVDEIDEILALPGLDGIIYGPNDMSGTTSRFLDRENPELLAAIDRIQSAAIAAGIPVGAGAAAQTMAEQVQAGAQLVLEGSPMTLLRLGSDKIVETFRTI
jgi:2-keto-3-deoxy-L-rhamnonate aldolase RhmA